MRNSYIYIYIILVVLFTSLLTGCKKQWGRKHVLGTWKLDKVITYHFDYNSDSTEVINKTVSYEYDWSSNLNDSVLYIFEKDSFELLSTYSAIISYAKEYSMINEVAYDDFYSTHIWGDTTLIKMNKARNEHFEPELFYVLFAGNVDQVWGANIMEDRLHLYYAGSEYILSEL